MCKNLNLWLLPFIVFCQVFSRSFFTLWLSVLLHFLFFELVFLSSFIFSSIFSLILYMFFTYVVSSLVYPNLLGNKMVGCCCCMLLDTILLLCSNIFARKTEWCGLVFWFHIMVEAIFASKHARRKILLRSTSPYRLLVVCAKICSVLWEGRPSCTR
jgi:hypothetical protein